MGNIFANNPPWSIGIIIVLFGIIAAHRLVSHRNKIEIFNKAAKEISDTFHRELKEVYPIPGNWPGNIDHYLRARFDNLSEAVGKFKGHLPKRKQKAFSDAWFSYYCYTGREIDRNCQCYHHYMPFFGSSVVNGNEIQTDNTKTYKENLKKHVDIILGFAKPK